MADKPRNSRAAAARPKKAPPKKVAPKGALWSTVRDFSGDVLDNALPNFGDEIAGFGGGVGSWLSGRGYSQGYNDEKRAFIERQKRYDKEHPKLAWGSTIAGNVVGMGLPAGKVMKGATRLQKVKQGAKVGAAYGALAGAGAGEGLNDRAVKAVEGAPLGAAVGYVAPGLIDDAVKAAPKVANTVREILTDTTASVPRAPKAPDGVLSSNKLKAVHYSDIPDLTVTDPAKWGTNRRPGFTPKEELAKKGLAPDRTYFGLAEGEGVSRPYSKEAGVGPYAYEAELPADRFFDADAGKPQLAAQIAELPQENGRYTYAGRSFDGGSLTEQLIKDAGYAGYRTNNPQLGDVAAAFEPVQVSRIEKPIEGAPTRIRVGDEVRTFGPYDPLRHSARKYAEEVGLEYTPPSRYVPVDEDRAARVAQAYQDMRHDPADPEVRQAYEALAQETQAQYAALKKQGYKFSFQDPQDDVYPNPWEAIADLRDNKRMQVYPTDAGYGEGGITPEMVAENPLLTEVPGETWGAQPVRVNDLFRAVHDAYGHAKEGIGFRATGEENAFRQHLPMFSEPAQRALATETRGQNSWLNFGPYGETNRTAKTADTRFADQKIGLMPDEFALSGTEDFMPDPRSTAYGYRGTVPGKSGAGLLYEARLRNTEGLQALLSQKAAKAAVPSRSSTALSLLSRDMPVGRRMALDDTLQKEFPSYEGSFRRHTPEERAALQAKLEADTPLLDAVLKVFGESVDGTPTGALSSKLP